MSVSGSRAAVDIDLDDFEKRLRAAGAVSSAVEDPLAELARLVEASRPKPAEPAARVAAAPAPPAPVAPPRPAYAPPPPPAPVTPQRPTVAPPRAVAPPAPVPASPVPPAPIETAALRPAFDDAGDHDVSHATAHDQAPDFTEEAEEPFAFEVEPEPEGLVRPPAPRRPRRWLMTVSILAIAGVAMIGTVFALKGGVPGFRKSPPFIAAAQGPTKVQPPSDATVAASNESGANLFKDATQANKVKVVSNEEQPVDLTAQTAQPPAPVAAPAAAPVVRGTVDAPVVVTPPPAAPTAASPFPEPKPVRTISLRPDGTPISASAADAATSPTPPSQPAPEPAKPAAKPVKPAADAGNAQASTPKIDLPTKLSPPKSSARVAVAKTDTTAPGGGAEAVGEPIQGGAPAKPAKVKNQEAAVAPAETGATTSGGWAAQLAAPRSEAEAKGVIAKLNEKYASALGGSALAVHKATVRGETVYRVRATGLSKADAAALCARITGDGGQCFIAK